ncbi:hypothetical protein M3P21_05425 [Ruegeria sp. 2012CJ41-6]|uniref:Uncharacterized protein n=1 Tax=Ruegeria spongiae TaxID=2942209 RepID=A0ABT0PZC1_9RHOB|nr:hypothetical protein [Ruegeria spongiae]MCL6282969.1 hypothetical protein [Ruegeria spongiae]
MHSTKRSPAPGRRSSHFCTQDDPATFFGRTWHFLLRCFAMQHRVDQQNSRQDTPTRQRLQ